MLRKKVTGFRVLTDKDEYFAANVVIATGYYDNPNRLGIEGEDLPNVFHYFKEAHPYFGKKVVVIGGKEFVNRCSARIGTCWCIWLPLFIEVPIIHQVSSHGFYLDFDSLVRSGDIDMHFNADVVKITDVFRDD